MLNCPLNRDRHNGRNDNQYFVARLSFHFCLHPFLSGALFYYFSMAKTRIININDAHRYLGLDQRDITGRSKANDRSISITAFRL